MTCTQKLTEYMQRLVYVYNTISEFFPANYTAIITEHESLHQKKQFDWTLRGHDLYKRDVYIQ